MKNTLLLISFLLATMFSTAQSTGLALDWERSIDDGEIEVFNRNVQTDGDGNIFVAGEFFDLCTFNLLTSSDDLNPADGNDVYIGELNTDGDYLWIKEISATDLIYCRDLNIDADGNLYIGGDFSGSVDFDPGPGTTSLTADAGTDIYIAKYDHAGNLIWVISPEGYGICQTLATSSDGSIYIGGRIYATTDFDPGAGVSEVTPDDYSELYFAKYDADGNFEWVHIIPDGDLLMRPIETDAEGNIYLILGSGFYTPVDIDPGAGTTYPAGLFLNTNVIAKYDSDGNFLWYIAPSADYDFQCNAITVDGDENIYITGYFRGTLNFDQVSGAYITGPDNHTDIFIAKYDASGGNIWGYRLTGSSELVWHNNAGKDILVDNDGNILVMGEMMGTVDFDPGIGTDTLHPVSGYTDIFLSLYSPEGEYFWTSVVKYGDIGLSITKDMTGNIFLESNSDYYDADFDPGYGVEHGFVTDEYQSTYIVKYHPDTCRYLGLAFSGSQDISCTESGSSSVLLYGGMPALSVAWNTTPVVTDTFASFTEPGIYSATVTDMSGCSATRSILISAPDSAYDFDLQANLFGTQFRPGDIAQINMNGFNGGCEPESGAMELILDPRTDYTDAGPEPDAIAGDTLTWNFTSLNYDMPHLNPYINLLVSDDAAIGDTLYFTTIISPVDGDADADNNIRTYYAIAVNSYDPNYMTVYPQGTTPMHFIGNNQTMYYAVHFQNTGTANAENIFILDTLDASLDPETASVIGWSDPVITEVLPGNVLKFTFSNINLPDSMHDVINSTGYVEYSIRQNPDLPDNTELTGTAHIYFDNNIPVTTNTVFNRIGSANAIEDPEGSQSAVVVYPDPASEHVIFRSEDKGSQIDFVMRDAMNRNVYKGTFEAGHEIVVDLAGFAKGLYFISFYQNQSLQQVSQIIIQ